MQLSERARGRERDPRSIQIKGGDIKAFLKAKPMTQVQLASLLGVNPASLSRWANDKDDAPTSTAFLVMIPLLLSVGIDVMPKHYELAVREEFEAVFGQNELKKKADKLRNLASQRFLSNNPDVRRARKLFKALAEAWRLIDARQRDKAHQK